MFKKLFFHQEILSETYMMKLRRLLKILQCPYQMIWKCKNSHQSLCLKENLLLSYSTKIKFLYHTEFFQMIRITKKTLYFLEWKILKLLFYKSSILINYQPFILWQINLKNKLIKRKMMMNKFLRVEFKWI